MKREEKSKKLYCFEFIKSGILSKNEAPDYIEIYTSTLEKAKNKLKELYPHSLILDKHVMDYTYNPEDTSILVV